MEFIVFPDHRHNGVMVKIVIQGTQFGITYFSEEEKNFLTSLILFNWGNGLFLFINYNQFPLFFNLG